MGETKLYVGPQFLTWSNLLRSKLRSFELEYFKLNNGMIKANFKSFAWIRNILNNPAYFTSDILNQKKRHLSLIGICVVIVYSRLFAFILWILLHRSILVSSTLKLAIQYYQIHVYFVKHPTSLYFISIHNVLS